jgi:guanine nucleotide-binding protein subunit alpha
VIFLNLVYSVNTILNVLTDEMPDTGSRDMSHGPKAQEKSTPTFTSQHRLLKLRLGPLHQIQNDLETLLGLPPASVSMVTGIDLYDPASIPETIPLYHEFRVVSRQGWKSILDKVKDEQKAHLPDHVDDDIDPRRNRALRRGAVRTEDVADVIACCAADIKALWADSVVQGMLRKCELTLEDWAGL